MKKDKEVVKTVKTRMYFAQVMKHQEKYTLLHLIMQGKLVGNVDMEEKERHSLKT